MSLAFLLAGCLIGLGVGLLAAFFVYDEAKAEGVWYDLFDEVFGS